MPAHAKGGSKTKARGQVVCGPALLKPIRTCATFAYPPKTTLPLPSLIMNVTHPRRSTA